MQDKKWNVHKAIVCSGCDFIQAATRFGKEEAKGRLDLPADDPEIVEIMLQFIYERNYHLPSESIPGPHWLCLLWKQPTVGRLKHYRNCERSLWRIPVLLEKFPRLEENVNGNALEFDYLHLDMEAYCYLRDVLKYKEQAYQWPVDVHDLSIHAKVCPIADKYFVKGLKATAREKFEESMRGSFTGKPFYDAVKIVCTTTPDFDTGLRDLVVQRVSEEKEKYGLQANSGFRRALENMPDLKNMVLRFEDEMRQRAAAEAADNAEVAPRVGSATYIDTFRI